MPTINEEIKYLNRLVRVPGFWEGKIVSVFIADDDKVRWVLQIINSKVKYENPFLVFCPEDNHWYFIKDHELEWQYE